MSMLQERLERAEKLLAKNNLAAVLAASPANFFYMTGTWLDCHERMQVMVIPQAGSAAILIPEMSREEIKPLDNVHLHCWKDGDSPAGILAGYLPGRGTIAVDNAWMSRHLIQLMQFRPKLQFAESDAVLEAMRLIKDDLEVQSLRESASLADHVMKEVSDYIRPGLTERQVADMIRTLCKESGADQLSFEPIVATGANGAVPHHQPDDTEIAAGDFVIIDMGGVKNHYCSDITRTIAVGDVTDEMQHVYAVVRQAQEAAAQAVRPGAAREEVDRAARNVIEEAGFGQYFTHRTGHGIGIEVHEGLSLAPGAGALLEPGMVTSIEPGIYLPGKFGVRIEDIVVVTPQGSERLNRVSRELVF